MKKYTTEEYIAKAQKVHAHPDGTPLYTYQNTQYVKSTANLIITCPIHGDFKKVAVNHLLGAGCEKCSKHKYVTANVDTELAFIAKSKNFWGDGIFDYSKVIAIDGRLPTHVDLRCIKHDTWFNQSRNAHLSTNYSGTKHHGCPICKMHSPRYRDQFVRLAKSKGENNGGIYIVRIDPIDGEPFFVIGVTTQIVKVRLGHVDIRTHPWTLIASKFGYSPEIAYDHAANIREKLRKGIGTYKYVPFLGMMEIFPTNKATIASKYLDV